MTSIRWTGVKLGIFTVVTIIVTIWLAAVIGNLRLFSSPYSVSAEFTDASGLLKGDVVKVAGVTVGRVSDIHISNGIAIVDMSVDENVDLPAGLGAAIRFRNLVGQRMVVLTGEGSATDSVESGYLIPLDQTQPAFDLTALFNGLRPLIRSTNPTDINIVTREVTKAFEGRGQKVKSLLDNLALVGEMLAGKDQALNELLNGFSTVTADLASRDAQLSNTLSSMDELLTALADDKDELDAALVVLDDAATRLARIVDRNDSLITAEVDDLSTILDAVNDKRQDLRRVIRALPKMLVAVERAGSYGQWANIHLIQACKDDLGTCGRQGTP
ncbi:MAG: phospholipid/cholesterol/gamma-HCH transport system substrate-binding protein [Actinomycetota bacterium]|jgi:phospholipid/cholesterol/gamma-HCH transport system substrate-binding protein|nr:phospholipid/cholesterol/gamma-HCH transport system substrate-binding protein [Actinomycetota bacterium]